MVDHIHFLEQCPQFGTVADISTREMDIWRERLRVARGEVINPTDLVALAGKLVGKRRAEESRGSGDEKVHSLKIINERAPLKRLQSNLEYCPPNGLTQFASS